MRLTLLGTGGPIPDVERAGPSVMVEAGSTNLLFDAGRGVVTQLLRAGFDLAGISDLFITHHHYDHISDIGDLAISSWLAGRAGPLHIYGPPGTRDIVDAIFATVYGADIAFRDQGEPHFGGWRPTTGRDLDAGQPVEGPRWITTPGEVCHEPGLPVPSLAGRWRCYGYRVESEGKSIVVSGDTIACEQLRRLAADADVLVMCAFFADSELTTTHRKRVAQRTLATPSTAGALAQEARVGTLILTHIRPKSTSQLDEMTDTARQHFSGEVILGHDLMTHDV